MVDVADLDRWCRTLDENTAAQYGARVRAFFARRPNARKPVSRSELIEHCAAIASMQMRSKTISALDGYFSYREEHGSGERHPATRLAKRITEHLRLRQLENSLLAAGMSRRQAETLSWRDVALDLFGAKSNLPIKLSRTTRDGLGNELLTKLRSATTDTIGQILDAPILAQ